MRERERERMKINVVSSKLIKPYTPTPLHLKNYSISFLDELIPPMNMAFLLFYPSKPKHHIHYLQESLAEILSQFHVLAGRYSMEDHSVDCSDQGAEFVQAEADGVEVMDLVGKIESRQLYDLLPPHYFRKDEAASTPLLSVQTTDFKLCGGLVMCISVSHRVLDASSAGAFISAWSNAANPTKTAVFPTWNLPSLLPCKNIYQVTGVDPVSVHDNKIVIKSFLFNKEAIARLRLKLVRAKKGKPIRARLTRVRLVTALIARALIRMDRAKHPNPRDYLIFQPIDMRGRTVPPLPKHFVGNFALASLTRRIAAHETGEIGVEVLVDIIGDAIEKSVADYAGILMSPHGNTGEDKVMDNLEKLGEGLRSGEVSFINFSDLSKLELYEADFGSGKPVWSSYGPLRWDKTTMLMRNREGGGIEARVHLEQKDMHRFQEDQDIRSFATYI